MQVHNETPYVRIVQHTLEADNGERAVRSYPVEPRGAAHIPDHIWNAVHELDPIKLWGLRAKPDEKLELAKLSASEAITACLACSDPVAIEGALKHEKRKSVIATLHVRAEELKDGGEASN